MESSQKVSSKRRPTDFGGLSGFKNNTVGEGLPGDSTTTVATGAELLGAGKRSGGASSPKRSHHCGDNNGGQQRARNNSPPAMDRDHRHHRATNGFILGDDDSDDDDILDSASDISSDGGVGEVNTAMSFVLDEDSGLGFSTSPSGDDESAERVEQPAELVPLRPMVVGSSFTSRGPRKSKLHFDDFYRMGNDHLGSGAYASVRTATSISTGKEYAVKLVGKHEPGHTRSRILREVDTFKMCKNHPNIVQLIEWFEDENYFYMVFEKVRGGPLLNHIQRKVCFTEQEATLVTRDIATALKYLHDRGIAHRDIKPENILCVDPDRVSPVKICDLDLASKPHVTPKSSRPLPTVHSEPDLASPVGSAEFMAPEVVDAFVGDALKYDKRCDMWSLGVIIYIMLCGYPPFYGECESENCGWDQGEQCTDCQESLFHRIQRGDFDFPEEEWANISREAKDLISHLLVKNVRQRYTADDVLEHPWVVHGAPKTPLLTANNLFRNDSTRDMHQMQEHFNVMNRFNQVHEERDSSCSPPEASSLLPLPCDTDAAMPDMRGSWIAALQQNVHNLANNPTALLDGDLSAEEELLSLGNNRPSEPRELRVSERSLPSSEADGTLQAVANAQHTGLLTSARPGANPVTRPNEGTADRQGFGRGSSRRDNSLSEARQTDSGDSPLFGTASFDTRPGRTKEQDLRDQLQETKSLLKETQSENERLRSLFEDTDDFGDDISKAELIQKICDLESDIEDLQSSKAEELQTQRCNFEQQLQDLRDRLEHEEACKRKLQKELRNVQASHEQQLSAVKMSYEDTIKKLRGELEERIKELRLRLETELDEEKQVTKLVLDAIIHEGLGKRPRKLAPYFSDLSCV
ncbi:Protein kinase domain containing protein [Aphelenchoides avenae]|nr:Protein kinase domain containing protein [Aphelenchus avenae]